MKKKIADICIIILVIIIGGNYVCKVRYIGGETVGFIMKDEQENVTAEIFVTLYNGGYFDKKVIFDVDGSNEYLEGNLQEEKYKVTDIEVLEGTGQVNIENGILMIPSHGEVRLRIIAHNVYIGEDYQGRSIGLRREPPKTSFVVLK